MTELEQLTALNDKLQIMIDSSLLTQSAIENLTIQLSIQMNILFCLILTGIVMLYWFKRRRTKWM